MLIRTMTPKDVTSVAAIEAQCFSQPWSEKSLLDSLAREDTIFLVCEEECNSQIAGYMGMYVSFEEGSITNVAVSPEYRKKGCAKLLVAELKRSAKEVNIENIFLEVRVSNEPAISLYKKMGFEELGVRRKFYEHPTEDAIIMSCRLTDSE